MLRAVKTMDKKLTEEELQEINRFTEQFAHQTEDRKNVLSLLSHIEQLYKEIERLKKQLPNIAGISGSFDGVTDTRKYTMPIGEYNDLLEKIEQQAQEIERLKGQLFELSESSYKNVMILMEQRNKANDECEQLSIKSPTPRGRKSSTKRAITKG
jgi:predicted RNase H-like nuclease (RuvC/YqgF family)